MKLLLLLLLRLGCCRCSPPLPAIVALGSVVAGGRRAFFLPCSIYPPPLKALTVLEYLVAHGSESVIDEIKEHAYQISSGRAYFELVHYLDVDRAFSLARRPCPCSLDGMDIYSTVLYHLKEDMKLSYLVQELLSINRLAPQTWVRICMSSSSKEGSKAFCCTYMYTWDRRMKN